MYTIHEAAGQFSSLKEPVQAKTWSGHLCPIQCRIQHKGQCTVQCIVYCKGQSALLCKLQYTVGGREGIFLNKYACHFNFFSKQDFHCSIKKRYTVQCKDYCTVQSRVQFTVCCTMTCTANKYQRQEGKYSSEIKSDQPVTLRFLQSVV